MNCSCISSSSSTTSISDISKAEQGRCSGSCDLLPVFLGVVGVMIVLLFLLSMPALTATLRLLPDRQRAFG